MPLAKLDTMCALLVVDVQRGIVEFPTAHPPMEIASRCASLAAAFRQRGWPVVLINVVGAAPGRTDNGILELPSLEGWSDFVEVLRPQPTDRVISKKRFGAFLGTDLDQNLRASGVTQVVIGGISTSIGVESTARSAYDLGYNVALVTDAMTDRNAEMHRHSVERVFPRLGETCVAADVQQLLNSGAG